jgi:hypothetical protein
MKRQNLNLFYAQERLTFLIFLLLQQKADGQANACTYGKSQGDAQSYIARDSAYGDAKTKTKSGSN